jgi:hypothetical protein
MPVLSTSPFMVYPINKLPPSSPIKPGTAPTGVQILKDPGVMASCTAARSNSKKNTRRTVHEEKIYVFMDPVTGQLFPVSGGPGAPESSHPAKGTTVDTIWYNPSIPTNPIKAPPGTGLVGLIHTHPWHPWPSGNDGVTATTTGVPQIVLYGDNPCQAVIFGPLRRPTLTGPVGW